MLNWVPFARPTTALTVNSLNGKSEVFLDGKKVGETPYSSEQLSPGDHEIEVRRISNNDSFYQPIQRTIHLELGTRTFLEVEVGPSEQFSSMKLVYYRKSSIEEPGMYISSAPSGAEVLLDGVSYGKTPVTSNNIEAGRHDVAISLQGYLTSETTVIARSGYTLIMEFSLMTQPIDLQEK